MSEPACVPRGTVSAQVVTGVVARHGGSPTGRALRAATLDA
ncbi:hypothetical protein [Pseudonocardia kongjuensis]